MPRPIIDIAGQTFGRLYVTSQAGRTSGGSILWNCTCECGTETVFPSNPLRTGAVISCGCWRREVGAKLGKANVIETPGYAAAHYRVSAAWGPASEYGCLTCDSQAEEWAYTHVDRKTEITGPQSNGYIVKYSPNPAFYVAMCVRCHRSFDAKHAEARRANRKDA